MADTDHTLIVPVTVDALVVNRGVRIRGGRGFRRWKPNFNLLRRNLTPEPRPFTNDEPEFNDNADNDGVYVRWQVPEALRHGMPRDQGEPTVFPLVPNRWLVVRHVRDQLQHVTGWLVDSDFLHSGDGTSRYLHPVRPGVQDLASTPYRSTVTITKIGRRHDLGPTGTAWSEPTGPERKELFLTAVGPGLMTFHAFQAYNENVFSLHDALPGIDKATVGYQVIGWYSDPAQEELRRQLAGDGATVEKVLTNLGWTVVPALQDGWTPTATTCCGRVVGIAWDRTGDAPPSNRPATTETVKVAVGSSAPEATAILVAQGQTMVASESRDDVARADGGLLHMLGRGLVDTLDGPDGDILAAQAIHRGWFEQRPGGHVWRVVNTAELGTPSGEATSVTWSGVTAAAERTLATLNTDQDAYDACERELAALRWRLYALWWLHGLPFIPAQYTREQFRAEIDPANPDGLAAAVRELRTERDRLLARIPHGANAAELAAAVATYLEKHPLPSGHELRREALPPFWQPTDPTVVLSGVNNQQPHTPLDGADSLACRMPTEIVGGVSSGGQAPPAFTGLHLTGLPALVPALLGEFAFLLDPANKDRIPPGTEPAAWRQPWKPLLYQWTVRHWPVPYGQTDDPNWQFDGSGYSWKQGDAGTPFEVSGRRFLVPLPQYVISSQLAGYADDHSGATGVAFADTARDTSRLDLLSQSLDGLTDAFACRDPAPNLSPPGEIGELVGDMFGHLPNPGPLPAPFTGWQPSGFTQIRAGRFEFRQLCVIDEFGQSLDVYLTGDVNRPVVADSVYPRGKDAETAPTSRFSQLAPRLLQAARLRFDFVNELDDAQLVDLTAQTTPACAWIVPNYVDRALLCYAPTGAPLGELGLRLTLDKSTSKVDTVVAWSPLPDSQTHSLEDLRTSHPHLHQLATALTHAGPATFLDLLSSTDRALTTIDPGNPYGDEVLGTLLGRPLALVRARLGFELDGPPVSDPGWQYALDWRVLTEWRERTSNGPPTEPDHLRYRWPIRLGNAGQHGDGLIGYFAGADYRNFYAVATPDTAKPTGYVQEIGPDNWPRLPADSTSWFHLTLLFDPQAAVHATTDLLPVTDLRLPNRFTRTALAAINVALRLSPVLTAARRMPVKDDNQRFTTALALPHPTSPLGSWSWSELVVLDGDEQAAPTWGHHTTVPIDQTARLDEDGPTVRTGFLRLTGGLDDG